MKREIPTEYRDHLTTRGRAAMLGGEGRGITGRGFWTGAFLSFFLAAGVPYANMVMHSTFMAWDFNTPGAIFLFLVLVGLLNVLFKVASRSIVRASALAALAGFVYLYYYWPLANIDWYSPGWMFVTFLTVSSLVNVPLVWSGRSLVLNRSDLVLVYLMLLVVSSLCSMGMSQQLLPIITAFYYYASPQNKWMEKLSAHFPNRGVLVDDGAENEAFYEGLEGTVIPYEAWVEPLIWWSVFLLALYVVMISAAVILRRQWMDRERLAYPITQVGVAIVSGEEENRLVNGFLRNRAMWYGCAIPLLIGSLNALHAYDPAMPKVSLRWSQKFLMHQSLELNIHFAMVGFSYLINTSISAGLWVFQLLVKVENELLFLSGFKSEQSFVYGIANQPYLAYQGGGALIALTLLGLWTGREHLKDVFGKAFGLAPEVDDGDEIISYRGAVFGLIGGTAVMVAWLWVMGTQLWVALLFVVLALLIFIGISRVVVEAGLAAVRSPMIAPDLMIQGLGSTLVGTSGVFNLSLAYIWCADIRVFVLAMVANGLKLIEAMDHRSRRLILWGVYLAVVIGAVGSCWMVLHMAYRHGGINLEGWFFKGSPAVVYNNILRNLEPAGVAWDGLIFFFGGGAVMLLLTWARHQLPWWPLHSLGFAVANNHLMDKIWFSVLIAWVIKKAVMRFGGAAVYRKSQSFFLGLIAGEVMCNGLWIIIDFLTGKTGNKVFIIG